PVGSMAERAQIVVKGIVQGVGFRPYVYNLAEALGLKGYVTNTSEGVFIDVEGARVPEFIQRLQSDAPPLSRITDLSITPQAVHGYSDFTIQKSLEQAAKLPFTLISPDVSICDACLHEMLKQTDRRYLYPFINCTNCGPRYSITRAIPYDRPNTTMSNFALCPLCRKEYDDPGNRRFHAQPNACPACGPQVEFKAHSAEFGVKGTEAVQRTIELLKQGGIVAVKGLGGFHLACDAVNDDAVKRLREKKRKSNKPFAVMSFDIQSVEQFSFLANREREILLSNRRPIVLLRKKDNGLLSATVAPNNNYVGTMLPYTPLHYLLFSQPPKTRSVMNKPHFLALVMTSGNLSEEPIVRDNSEAMQKLNDIVDGFLVHNRDIFMRLDDSVVRVRSVSCTVRGDRNPEFGAHSTELMFVRRSRGYVPDPIALHDDGPEVLGCGADLKNTFTLTKGKFAVPSQHIGDMENFETLQFYEECLANLKAVYRAEPKAIVHDLHPGYLSTRWAVEQGMSARRQGTRESDVKLFAVQHHYAHIGSVMAEHGLTQKVIGVALDGTGYGTDGNLWGGEFLVADIEGFERKGHFNYVALPGGEAAIKEPWKTAVSFMMTAADGKAREYLRRAGFYEKYGEANIEQVMLVSRSRDFSPLSSGAGRLFDAVSALIGICDRNTFEGEAAMALESLTQEGVEDEYAVDLTLKNENTVIDYSPAFREIIADLDQNVEKEIIATKFHNTVASVVRSMVRYVREKTGLSLVALSGGTFQNQYLLNGLLSVLDQDGFTIMTNQNVPCNDACISLGQAYLVRERLKK
ncbi:MAG TPA: carbamoyltransferase HypF, partial [Nitrospirota bacterium]|nr:carbamoyltransferase HypF [Nitrospirota bacterium]